MANKKTLEEYFKTQKTIDHAVRHQIDSNGNVSFYIYPLNIDGDTLDFVVEDNRLFEVDKESNSEDTKTKMKTFMVNGREKTTPLSYLSYNEIVELAGYNRSEDRVYDITFHNGVYNTDGILHRGEVVHIVDGMIFNCFNTGSA